MVHIAADLFRRVIETCATLSLGFTGSSMMMCAAVAINDESRSGG